MRGAALTLFAREPVQHQTLMLNLGSKLEEFDNVCDELYQLAVR